MSSIDERNLENCPKRLDLEFTNVTLSRNGKYGLVAKEILHGVSGRFNSGRLTAILGPSGAGKTSLLNVLSGFRTCGFKGSVRVNGKDRVLQTFRKECSYITQEFAMLELLTVRETFKATADLKLSNKVSDEEKFLVIAEIAKILNLTSCMNTQVRHLSGGEKKRLSIGLELITNPPIMFFDEPTSGLDSSSSVQVMSHLQALAKGGRAIICVIHQPSSKIFEMFDDLFIMVNGRCFYQGTLDDMVPVLESVGFKCPKYYNRADFAIEVACKDRGEDTEPLFEIAQRLADTEVRNGSGVKNQEINIEPDEDRPMLGSSKHTAVQIVPLNHFKRKAAAPIKYPISTLAQFWVLLKRTFVCTCIRDLHMAQIRFIAQIIVGVLMGVVFFQHGNDASKVVSNASYLFFSLMFIFFSNAMPTVQTFPSEAAVFFREHLNNWYSVKAYYFSKLTADLPLQVINPTIYLLITYFMTEQPLEVDRLFKVLLLGFLTTTMAQALGHAIGAAFDAQLGTFLVPATAIPMFLFSGFFIPFKDLPPYLGWMAYVSYFRYPFEGLMLAIYSNGRANLPCRAILCRYRRPQVLLEDYDLSGGDYWVDILGIVAWIVFLRVAFYAVLKWRLYRIRGY